MTPDTEKTRSLKPGDEKASTQVYDILLRKLLGNELVPGDMLNRRDVARELGVSVAPVLEAMLQLENEGFLEGIPRKGTRVRPVRPADVVGQLIVREALECEAARMYCGKPVSESWDRLLVMASELDGCHIDEPRRWELEIAFHRTLVQLTGCQPLAREFERNFRLTVFHRINHMVGVSSGDLIDRHTRLLETLRDAGPDEAERAVRAHVRSGKGHLFQ